MQDVHRGDFMRSTRSNKRKWIIPGILTVILGTAGTVTLKKSDVEMDLSSRAMSELKSQGLGWADVSFDARDAKLVGTAPNQEAQDQAEEIVKSLYGVRSVTTDMDLLPVASPYPFSVTIKAGEVMLEGGAPDEATKSSLIARSLASSNSLELLAGTPDITLWNKATDFAISNIQQFESGEISLSDLTLSISGTAKTGDTYNSLNNAIASELPNGVSLGDVNIAPPLVSPYIWSADYDGDIINIEGYSPDKTLDEIYDSKAPKGTQVKSNLLPASGEPEDFADVSSKLIEAFKYIEYGNADISDNSSNFFGAPRSEEAVLKINELLSPLETKIRLEPPRITDYRFSAELKDSETILQGYVPHETIKAKLGEMEGFDISNLKLGWGAPANFENSIDFGLSALKHLSEGNFSLANNEISIAGTASTPEDFAAINQLVASGVNGDSIKLAQITPPVIAPSPPPPPPPVPVASPYLWLAEKSATGAHIFSGFVPQESLKNYLSLLAENVSANNLEIAIGEPDNFANDALAGLEALKGLEKGRVAYNGTEWSLIGQASSQQAKQLVLETLGEGSDISTWKIDIAAPIPVASEKYRFVATKPNGGDISLAGDVPNIYTQNYIGILAGKVATDGLNLLSPAPDGFKRAAFTGIAALKMLENGQLSFRSKQWYLTGVANNEEVKEKVIASILAISGGENWSVNISVPAPKPKPKPEPAPKPEPKPIPVASENYRFVATKLVDGSIGLNGDVPTEQLKNYIGIAAGKVATDNLAILYPAPDSFKRSLFTGIRALKTLEQGQLSLRSKKWYLTGIASDEGVRDAAIASLEGFSDWNVNISVEKAAVKLCRKDVAYFAENNAILFDVGKAILKPESDAVLSRLAKLMNNCVDTDIHVQGHTDSDGSEQRNLTLSVDRAEAVVNSLVNSGVSSERLFAIGYGESMPVDTNETEEGKRNNRRTVFSIVSKSN